MQRELVLCPTVSRCTHTVACSSALFSGEFYISFWLLCVLYGLYTRILASSTFFAFWLAKGPGATVQRRQTPLERKHREQRRKRPDRSDHPRRGIQPAGGEGGQKGPREKDDRNRHKVRGKTLCTHLAWYQLPYAPSGCFFVVVRCKYIFQKETKLSCHVSSVVWDRENRWKPRICKSCVCVVASITRPA